MKWTLRPLMQRLRKDLLWVAFGIALLLLGEWLGARDMAARCNAQAAVVNAIVNDANTTANGNPAQDKFNEDHQ